MVENKELKAKISNKFSKSFWICLSIYIVIVVVFLIAGFGYMGSKGRLLYMFYGIILREEPDPTSSYYYVGGTRVHTGNIIWLMLIILLFISIPIILMLLWNRKRKLIDLTATDTELIGSYTAFIPISKITLKMPIEKIDNIAIVSSVFFVFTGKAIKISSTSGSICLPYVLNADEVVSYIKGIINKTKKEQITGESESLNVQSDNVDKLKKLAELRNSGIITEEEFNQKKKDLLEKI